MNSIQQNTTDSTKQAKRRRLYALQEASKEILSSGLTEGRAHPVTRCLHRPKKGEAVAVVVDSAGKAFYTGLQHCKNAWVCPVCASYITAARREEISQVLHKAHELGQDALLVTVTIQHHAGSKLKELLDAMLAAWRSVFSGDRSGERRCLASVAGQIKALEIRFGRSAGWHPHLHVMVLVDHAGMSADEAALLDDQIAAVIYSRYSKAVERRGMVASPAGYNCQTVKDLAGAVGRYIQKFEAGLELTAGQEKDGHLSYSPWQLLELYSQDPNKKLYGRSVADLFKEYVKATKGRRQISYSREMRELVTIKQDEEIEITEETEESKVKVELETRIWSYICRYHLRATVLEVAESGGKEELTEYLAGLRSVCYGTKRHT